MGFGAVGLVMLAIVLIFYMRMVAGRMKTRNPPNEIKGILEKAEVFESVADDQSALTVIQQALAKYPTNDALQQKEKALKKRLNLLG